MDTVTSHYVYVVTAMCNVHLLVIYLGTRQNAVRGGSAGRIAIGQF